MTPVEHSAGGGTTPLFVLKRTITVTNPLTRGDDVRQLQDLLTEKGFKVTADGVFGPHTAEMCVHAKTALGYPPAERLPIAGQRLVGRLQNYTPVPPPSALYIWPTSPVGTLIGFPGQGTHSYTDQPNNWESDNAWDIAVPTGSLILAVADGLIGPQFGPLPDPDPRFHGIRLHLVTETNEFYYAHLSATAPGIGPGSKVKQGAVIGSSGTGNGVAHLHLGMRALVDIRTFKPEV